MRPVMGRVGANGEASIMVATEFSLLGLAAIVGFVQIILAAAAGGQQRETAWLLGPRDDHRPVTGVAARLDRALKNFLESFPLFVAALIAASLAGKFGGLTLWGSALYVIGRAVYVPAYAMGIPVLRTVVWTVSMAGIIMVIVAIFG
jgi:uncharacterized MAPEG superfamily protein